MASKINYNNKAPFQTLEEIPDENKVNANDMNEIKTVVNNNADELNTAKEDIEGLQNGQGTASTDITSLKNRTTALETDNTTNKQNIQNLQTDNEINKTNITNLQNSKVDKVEGKNLSTNDFTNEYKQKLDNLSNYDDTEVKADIAELEEKVSTLEEDNTTNKTNIETLQEDNTQNKSDISDLQDSQEEQDAEIGILMNALPSETQESENINIKGTIPVKFKEFSVEGNSKQETREGYNLLNYNSLESTTINGVAFTINDDKSITANGTATANATFNLIGGPGVYPLELEEGDYTLNGCEGGSSSTYSMEIYDGTTYRACQNGKTTFNTTGTSIRFYISVKSGVTVNNVTFYPMLVKGTEEKEYEPYGVMPSPEYRSPIQNVEGDVNVTVCNKNLFNSKVFTSGSLITVNEDGSLILANNVNTAGYINAGKKLKELCKGLKAGDLAYLKLVTTASDNIYLQGKSNQYWVGNNSKKITEDMLEDTVIIYGGYQKTDTLQIQISLNKLEEYTQHQSQTITFPLLEGQKLMKGDYLAEDGIHHKRKQIELDGTDFSLYSSQVAGRTIYLISNFSNNNNFKTYDSSILCNILKQGTSSNGNNYLNNNGSSGSLYVSIENSILGITDESTNEEKLQAFQNLISETGFVYEGELAEEEIEPYTEIQQEAYNQLLKLKSYEGATNVYSTNETSPIFKVTAVKDINSVITQLNQLILENRGN